MITIKNKKGISEVITTVLLVLVAVVAVGLIASFLLPNVRNMLQSGSSCFDLRDYAQILDSSYTCYSSINTSIMIERGMSNLSIDSLAVSVITKASSKRYDIKDGTVTGTEIRMVDKVNPKLLTTSIELPGPGEARTYVLNTGNGTRATLGITVRGKSCEMETQDIPACL